MRPRAYWMTFHAFTHVQRERFRGILKLEPTKTDQFINLVETLVPNYVSAITVMCDYPLEPTRQTRERLSALSTCAKKLATAIDALHPYQSGARFEEVNFRLHHMAVDMDELRASLDTVVAVACAAVSQKSDRRAGRPQSRVHYPFIGACVEHYEKVFGGKPPYTHRSKFQNFLVAVSVEVLPPGQGLQGNITKLIEAAVEHHGTKP